MEGHEGRIIILFHRKYNKTYFDVVHAEDAATVVHVLLQILFKVLKDEREGLLRMHYIVQRHCVIQEKDDQ